MSRSPRRGAPSERRRPSSRPRPPAPGLPPERPRRPPRSALPRASSRLHGHANGRGFPASSLPPPAGRARINDTSASPPSTSRATISPIYPFRASAHPPAPPRPPASAPATHSNRARLLSAGDSRRASVPRVRPAHRVAPPRSSTLDVPALRRRTHRALAAAQCTVHPPRGPRPTAPSPLCGSRSKHAPPLCLCLRPAAIWTCPQGPRGAIGRAQLQAAAAAAAPSTVDAHARPAPQPKSEIHLSGARGLWAPAPARGGTARGGLRAHLCARRPRTMYSARALSSGVAAAADPAPHADVGTRPRSKSPSIPLATTTMTATSAPPPLPSPDARRWTMAILITAPAAPPPRAPRVASAPPSQEPVPAYGSTHPTAFSCTAQGRRRVRQRARYVRTLHVCMSGLRTTPPELSSGRASRRARRRRRHRPVARRGEHTEYSLASVLFVLMPMLMQGVRVYLGVGPRSRRACVDSAQEKKMVARSSCAPRRRRRRRRRRRAGASAVAGDRRWAARRASGEGRYCTGVCALVHAFARPGVPARALHLRARVSN